MGNEEILEKMVDLWVCVKCGWQWQPTPQYGRVPEKCKKCGGMMKKVVVLR